MFSRFADELLLICVFVEGKSGASLHGIRKLQAMDDGQIKEREISPGQEAVRSIPRIGPGLPRAEDIAVDVEVESFVRGGTGARVRAHQHVSFPKVVAERDLE